MLRPFFILSIVVLAKLHSGDGFEDDDLSQFFRSLSLSPPLSPLARSSSWNRSGRFGGGNGNGNKGFAPGSYKRFVILENGQKMEIPVDLFGDDENITESELFKRLKKREEENDPLSHQINTDGVVIEQQLPTGGQITIKISGSNINQRKMNKLRELMTDSVNFVFEHPEFKSGLMSRII